MNVDIHTHINLPSFIDAARRGQAPGGVTIDRQGDQEWLSYPQGYRFPVLPEFWDVPAKLKQMDDMNIDVSVVTITATNFFYALEADEAIAYCQQSNEEMAEFVAQSDGRLYGLATVPLQSPAAAATELLRAVNELGLRGVQIGTTMEHMPIDLPQFDPFWATAAESDVPVMLHPYRVATQPEFADFYMVNLVHNPLQTGLAATRLILSGCLDRHPGLTVVLLHGGGHMPYQIGRLDQGYRARSEANAHIQELPSNYLRRFYFDTITHAATSLKFLVDLAGTDRVMLGTDIPFDMADSHFAKYIAQLDPEAQNAISGGNAIRLFGLE